MLHEAMLSGRSDISIGLKYGANLDWFPYTAEGTRVVQLGKQPAKRTDAESNGQAEREAPQRGATGGDEKTHFGTELLSVEPLSVSDTAAGLTVSLKATLSVSWVVALMASAFRLPAVRVVASGPAVRAAGALTDTVGSVALTRYQLPPSYSADTEADTRLDLFIDATITSEQVLGSRRLAELVLGDNSTLIPLELAVVPGRCPALQIVAAVVGELNATISPALGRRPPPARIDVTHADSSSGGSSGSSSNSAGGGGAGGGGGSSSSSNSSSSVMQLVCDAIGLVIPTSPVPIQVLALPDIAGANGARIMAGVSFRSGSLMEAMLRAITGAAAQQLLPETEPAAQAVELSCSVALGDVQTACSGGAAPCSSALIASGELAVDFGWPSLRAAAAAIIAQVPPPYR